MRVLKIIAFILLLSLVACSGSRNPYDQDENEEATGQRIADQVFEGFEMTVTENGVKSGTITADRAEKYDSEQIVEAKNLEMVFFAENGAVESILTSKKGVIHLDSGAMQASDSVVVINADSTKTLKTERLTWDKEKDQVVSDTTVYITTADGDRVRGDGIVTDVGFNNLELKNPTGDISALGKDF